MEHEGSDEDNIEIELTKMWNTYGSFIVNYLKKSRINAKFLTFMKSNGKSMLKDSEKYTALRLFIITLILGYFGKFLKSTKLSLHLMHNMKVMNDMPYNNITC